MQFFTRCYKKVFQKNSQILFLTVCTSLFISASLSSVTNFVFENSVRYSLQSSTRYLLNLWRSLKFFLVLKLPNFIYFNNFSCRTFLKKYSKKTETRVVNFMFSKLVMVAIILLIKYHQLINQNEKTASRKKFKTDSIDYLKKVITSHIQPIVQKSAQSTKNAQLETTFNTFVDAFSKNEACVSHLANFATVASTTMHAEGKEYVAKKKDQLFQKLVDQVEEVKELVKTNAAKAEEFIQTKIETKIEEVKELVKTSTATAMKTAKTKIIEPATIRTKNTINVVAAQTELLKKRAHKKIIVYCKHNQVMLSILVFLFLSASFYNMLSSLYHAGALCVLLMANKYLINCDIAKLQ